MRGKEDESRKCTSGSSSAALVGGGEKHGSSARSILLSGVKTEEHWADRVVAEDVADRY